MNIKLTLVSAFFLLLCGISFQTSAQKNTSLFYPAIRNEKFTIQALRTIVSAEWTYQATSGNGNFASLAQLGQAGLIDEVLAGGEKYGYIFTLTLRESTPGVPASYQLLAVPQRYPKSGRRSFYANENGLIRGADKQGAPANQNDPLIEEYYKCDSFEECEANAITSLRTVHGAETVYQTTLGNGNYGSLCQLGQANLVDEILASGEKFGYYFVVSYRERSNNIPAHFEAIAIPRRYNQTGRRSFFVDEVGIIRSADRNGAPATSDDPPLNF